ncbi:MAG: hypothetical protein HUJ68_01025 [Clostridia bacterium]|nr:hypothetical protein [Clostridia bacterium]
MRKVEIKTTLNVYVDEINNMLGIYMGAEDGTIGYNYYFHTEKDEKSLCACVAQGVVNCNNYNYRKPYNFIYDEKTYERSITFTITIDMDKVKGRAINADAIIDYCMINNN